MSSNNEENQNNNRPSFQQPPTLIEPIGADNDAESRIPYKDIIKLRLEDTDNVSSATSSCGEDDEDPEQTFDSILASDPAWSQPADDVRIQMVALLDHYFSDENLIKDKFLLKHVRRNKQGYVSVKLLTSFKKLKHLSRSDWRVTAFCCRHSKQLELNTSGTKVKRKDQLPQIDLPTTSIRTILAKVPPEEINMTVDQISEIFRPFGCLSTVRLIRPGKEIPLDLRNHTAKHPEIGGQTCVVVEFDKTEDCQMAHKTLGKKAREDNNGWEYNLLGSGRNPRRQIKKMKAKARDYLGYAGYDSSEEFGSSPYVSSRENSPEVRRRTFGGVQNRNNSFLSPSPLASPYGSRSNSPARNSSYNNSPGFQRRLTTQPTGSNDKWSLSLRKQVTSPLPGGSAGKTPTSPLAVPNNHTQFKVSHNYDPFDYEIDTWSNDQYTESLKKQRDHPQHHYHHHQHHNQGAHHPAYGQYQSSHYPASYLDLPNPNSRDLFNSPRTNFPYADQNQRNYDRPIAFPISYDSFKSTHQLTKSYSNPNIQSFFEAPSFVNNNNEDTTPGSPWVRRRKDFLAASQGNTPIGSPCGSPTLGRKSLSPMPVNDSSPQSVVRLPRGPPDNATKGFQRLGGSEPQEMRVLAKLDILSSQVAAAVCDSQQN